MTNKIFPATLLCLFLFSFANAQNCDPWITQAYKQLYNRTPSADECNIKNYNNGSWNNYNELVGYIKTYNTKKPATSMPALTGDAWIFQVYKELYNRQPNAWELNIKNYNNGSWNNYDELKKYIGEFQSSLNKQNLQIKTAAWNNNNVLVGFFINGQQVAVNVVSPGGGNVVSAGGANVVSAGGANVVSAGGANVVSPGGGNIIVNTNMAGVNFGGRYSVQSAGTKVISTSGSGALIIK
ncbi:MAG TPA: hypothetical protein VGE79_02805 [Niastella sp.]